jgi:hypothetical protein
MNAAPATSEQSNEVRSLRDFSQCLVFSSELPAIRRRRRSNKGRNTATTISPGASMTKAKDLRQFSARLHSDWLVSAEGQRAISAFQVSGQKLLDPQLLNPPAASPK